MRLPLFTLLALCALAFSGCLSDDESGPDGNGTDTGSGVAAGTALGDWPLTFEGGPLAGAEAVDAEGNPTCSLSPLGVGSHDFTLPSANEAGVAWVAKPFTLTLTKTNDAAGELDIYLLDAEGNELASNTESDLMGTAPFVLSVGSLAPGDYTAQVHACSPSDGYTLDLLGSMVAS